MQVENNAGRRDVGTRVESKRDVRTMGRWRNALREMTRDGKCDLEMRC